MNLITIDLTNTNVTLTAYVLDSSHEMPNTHDRPAVLILPGGAYRACSDREAEPIAMAFLAEGYQAFTLQYSINQHAVFPKPLNDAEEALELIRENSSKWGIDPDKIAVCGFSAGGHLTASLGTMGKIRPNAMILGYPCILESMSSIFPAPVPGVDNAVDALTPPTFIFHTYEDQLVPVSNALTFADALNRAKVPFEMHIFTKGVHGLSLARPHTSGGLRSMVDPAVAQWFRLCITWLSNIFGEFSSERERILNDSSHEYSLEVQLGVLWKNETCKKLILAAIPVLGESPIQDAMEVPLRIILEFGGDLISEEAAIRLDHDLRLIPVA
ncbi:alpha/beta hydrolase [Paenibacillus sp. UASWS1643]|uniref:alpha/beta hydrolase n=1 Tax=Paenibacillus sp. UASWS1643 TaxID=2580422 RepID=UPI0012387E72|nr:alpha/beta hydrolase [Paenibacillus sp. UASWS1643]KAA8746148.1 alpha/beta hydrolase [Paenibacillus sp. UASWS1643]